MATASDRSHVPGPYAALAGYGRALLVQRAPLGPILIGAGGANGPSIVARADRRRCSWAMRPAAGPGQAPVAAGRARRPKLSGCDRCDPSQGLRRRHEATMLALTSHASPPRSVSGGMESLTNAALSRQRPRAGDRAVHESHHRSHDDDGRRRPYEVSVDGRFREATAKLPVGTLADQSCLPMSLTRARMRGTRARSTAESSAHRQRRRTSHDRH